MDENEIELKPVKRITVYVFGELGHGSYYLQGATETETVTLTIPRTNLQSIIVGIRRFIKTLEKKFPALAKADCTYDKGTMVIEKPLETLFLIGEMSIAYDQESDMVLFIVRQDVNTLLEGEPVRSVRFWCTRSQLLALSEWSLEVFNREDIEPDTASPFVLIEEEFSPRNNGHKK